MRPPTRTPSRPAAATYWRRPATRPPALRRPLSQWAAGTLWQQLGERYEAQEGSSAAAGLQFIPKAQHYEAVHLTTKVLAQRA